MKKQYYDFLAPLLLFILFLAVSIPGIDWGAPALWNPDELVWRVEAALAGEMQFDVNEPDYNYPSLPKNVMYAIGTVTQAFGFSNYAFIVSARIFSAVLGALVVVLVYQSARILGASERTSMLAGAFYIFSGVVAANSRFAHNDLYLQFFTFLCLFFVLKYKYTQKISWLMVSFLWVGMAASSKYTGVSMVLLPLAVLIGFNWNIVRSNLWRFMVILATGALLVILGYAAGTPRLLLNPIEYLSNAIPAALRFSQYGFNSGTPIGLYGQWSVFQDAVGIFEYYLFLLALLWFVARLFLRQITKTDPVYFGLIILLINILLFDLPFLVSINYIPRHFIPFIPLFSILAALFVDDLLARAHKTSRAFLPPALVSILFMGFIYSALRLASIALLFMNDARISASDYIAEIRGYGKSIEYTLYPPRIDKNRFLRAHNYPIYFVKYEGEEVPTGGRYEFNLGEQGLLERGTDYFVIDSYTYDRFYTQSICVTNPIECDFFLTLLEEDVKTYRLKASFTYRPPAWLPLVSVSAVNPDVLIYERVSEP